MMKKAWISLVFISFATVAFINRGNDELAASRMTVASNLIRCTADSVYIDSVNLRLSLEEIPRSRELHAVATFMYGKWAKVFTAIKLQESGADGKNSYLARECNNLTGMRMPGGSRPTTAIAKTRTNYAIFRHWYDCMVDFGFYLDQTLNGFQSKYKREPKDEFELINYMFGSYNPYSTWKRDVFWLIRNYNFG
jgi:hypothetical protein